MNNVDLEVMGPFNAVGMGSFEICAGETFEFWAAASGQATDPQNPMIILQV